jgi:tetraacyldisaccharide 4'-kinase
VSFDEPTWWYSGDSRLARVLAPLASVYATASVRRMRTTVPYVSRLPVVCIGNFTAGGTGKTPLTRAICSLLSAQGEAPAVLTRGYGGRIRVPHWVDALSDTALDVGDEPRLLAPDVPTLVSRDRSIGARTIEATGRHTVVVMDDGLQNPSLAKDLVIAVVDAHRGFGNNRVIPAGPLRAPLAFQFGLADAIVVNSGHGAGTDDGEIAKELRSRFPGPVIATHVVPLAEQGGFQRPVVAFAGIGAPDRFFKVLETSGATIAARLTFRDHHAFTPRDAERLLRLAGEYQADLVTTEKDHVRFAGTGGALQELGARAIPLRIALAFEPGGHARLASLVNAALKAKRG